MPKDTLTFNGLTLTAGPPSSAGKARFFGESPEHKTKVTIGDKIYTVYNKVSLYEEGSVPKDVKTEVEVTFDSKNRPVTKPKSKASTETPSAPPDLKAQLVALAAAMGLKLA